MRKALRNRSYANNIWSVCFHYNICSRYEVVIVRMLRSIRGSKGMAGEDRVRLVIIVVPAYCVAWHGIAFKQRM